MKEIFRAELSNLELFRIAKISNFKIRIEKEGKWVSSEFRNAGLEYCIDYMKGFFDGTYGILIHDSNDMFLTIYDLDKE